MKTIFVVTVMHPLHSDRDRTWGWYPTLDEAREAVLSNRHDLFEAAWHTLAVIEEFESGIPAFATKEHWFEAVYDDNGTEPLVQATEKPARYASAVSFGMG